MADGPRKNISEDIQKCSDTRKIIETIDWDCELKTLFFDENRGCGRAVVDGINWFFDNVEQGIILEDDCLPDDSFFPFCHELLNFYSDDARVMHINGNNFNIQSFSPDDSSYHFGSYPQAWGWATWRRAWEKFDFDLVRWPEVVDKKLLNHMNWQWYERIIQTRKYNELYNSSRTDIWDYQWHLTLFLMKGLTIVPKVNLVSNIGFGFDATHTTKFVRTCTELKTTSIKLPLNHPATITPDKNIDKEFRRIMIGSPATLLRMIKNRLVSYFGNSS
jgi:hypothetical protein